MLATDCTLFPSVLMGCDTQREEKMNAPRDANDARVNRRAALALFAGAGSALKVGVSSAAYAQSGRNFGPAQVLNGADARVFPVDIKSELKQLAPTSTPTCSCNR